MLKIFKRKKFPAYLFIFSSFAVVVLIPIFYFIFKSLTVNCGDSTQIGNKNIKIAGFRDPLITKNPNIKDPLTSPLISGNDPNMGSSKAEVAIVEFSDFTCSFCRQQEKKLQRIIAPYKNRIKLIWKDFPENNPASISWQAAAAGRCAYKQENFWPYHDLLFANGSALNKEKIIQLAKDLNLDLEKFKKCLADFKTSGLIKNNIEEANSLNIPGVPFIYINKQEVMGEATEEDLKKIIEAELNK
jgi:protein-disulfide isomerase